MGYVKVNIVAPNGKSYEMSVDSGVDKEELLKYLLTRLYLARNTEALVSYSLELVNASEIKAGVTIAIVANTQKCVDSAEDLSSQRERLYMPNLKKTALPGKIFIVHGHDDIAKLELKNYLQNTLKLPEPIILHEMPSLGRTLIEKFEEEAKDIDLVFVLLTPDDAVGDTQAVDNTKRRARQNVIFEMGYFFGKLQRKKGKVLLLHKGPLDIPSDISGIVYIDITNGIGSAGEAIRKELSSFI